VIGLNSAAEARYYNNHHRHYRHHRHYHH
jgi:hypothetical protein